MGVTYLCGDVLDMLATLPDESVQCVVTSPPYYGLRDYGTATWDGGDAACDHKPGKTAWRSRNKSTIGYAESQGHCLEGYGTTCPKCGARRIDAQIGLEPTPEAYVTKLVDVFREVRRVLRKDGVLWLNLGDSYWGGKGQNGTSKALGSADERGYQQPRGTLVTPMRPTDGNHDIIKPKDLIGIPWRVAFALQADGWWLRSDCIWHKPNPMPESVTDRPTKAHEYVFLLTKSARYYYDAENVREPVSPNWKRGSGPPMPEMGKHRIIDGARGHQAKRVYDTPKGANARTVWTIATQPYKGAHFATFPEKLALRCVLAGSKDGDTVLDPFGGSGTVGKVAVEHGRNAVLIDLNPQYIEMAKERIAQAKVRLPL